MTDTRDGGPVGDHLQYSVVFRTRREKRARRLPIARRAQVGLQRHEIEQTLLHSVQNSHLLSVSLSVSAGLPHVPQFQTDVHALAPVPSPASPVSRRPVAGGGRTPSLGGAKTPPLQQPHRPVGDDARRRRGHAVPRLPAAGFLSSLHGDDQPADRGDAGRTLVYRALRQHRHQRPTDPQRLGQLRGLLLLRAQVLFAL